MRLSLTSIQGGKQKHCQLAGPPYPNLGLVAESKYYFCLWLAAPKSSTFCERSIIFE